jgi:hypothetical protein
MVKTENRISRIMCVHCIIENKRLRRKYKKLQDENGQLKSTAELIDELLTHKNQQIEELERLVEEYAENA